MNYKNFGFKYTQNFIGSRFLTEDNNSELQSYYPANISLSYKKSLKKSKIIFQIDVNNIFEHEYIVMPAYPMPLRYFSFNLKYIFN
jgi:outer membrane cobalamin receptor